jgi:hypothetical protein
MAEKVRPTKWLFLKKGRFVGRQQGSLILNKHQNT